MTVDDLGRRFARVATDAVVRRPVLWRLFRRPLRFQFERLAPSWDQRMRATRLTAYEAALASVEPAPRRALDLGTGTGDGAFALARRFADAEIVGVDLAPAMVAEARRKTPPELVDRVRFQVGDASRLPFPSDSFELVAMNNMIPFFDEVTRVVAPGGRVLFAFSSGSGTPIYVPPARLKEELAARRFSEFAEFSTNPGTALVATLR